MWGLFVIDQYLIYSLSLFRYQWWQYLHIGTLFPSLHYTRKLTVTMYVFNCGRWNRTIYHWELSGSWDYITRWISIGFFYILEMITIKNTNCCRNFEDANYTDCDQYSAYSTHNILTYHLDKNFSYSFLHILSSLYKNAEGCYDVWIN